MLILLNFPTDAPPYAILSHTWGLEGVTVTEVTDLSKRKTKAGFNKIKQTCKQAAKGGLNYAWIDTCCINKESSSELSEAINCMFRWYRNAAICYAYLEDVSEDIELLFTSSLSFEHSRWFTQGWTLQELLAPRDIAFFSAKWAPIGRKMKLSRILEQIIGIPHDILTGNARLDQISVADRMNWVSKRQATREEDIAYFLMGIFDVNMPMVYGEGGKASVRLQEEIPKQTQDESLFAWRSSEESTSEAPYRGLVASSPEEFASDVTITPFSASMTSASTLLGNGRISLSCALYKDLIFGLKCFQGTDVSSVVGIRVTSIESNYFLRSNPSELVLKPHQYPPGFQGAVFDKIAEIKEPSPVNDIYQREGIRLLLLPHEISMVAVYPKKYKEWEKTMKVPIVSSKRLHVLLVLWVEQQIGGRSYTYYVDLLATKAEEAELKCKAAKMPLKDLIQEALTSRGRRFVLGEIKQNQKGNKF
ncbi:heterokaryon incompatibility domain-containing protein [Trichoderma barbatum]